MANISSPGIGSGLDVKTLISQLMQIEQQPLAALQTKQSGISSKISAYGSLSSALATLKTASTALNTPATIAGFKATLSDTTFGTSSATTSASAGTYSIAVTQLAKAHTIASTAVAAETTVIGEGSLTITSGSNSFGVTIDSSNNTLAGIRNAINNSASNTSVNASIVNDVNGARLVLAAKSTGSTNAISVGVVETAPAGLMSLSYNGVTNNMTQGNAAQNAELTINGVPISSSSNTVSTAITGVSLILSKDSSSTTLTVAHDSAAVIKAATDFASAYSTLATTIKNLTAYNTTTKTGSILTGDGTTSLIQSRIRTALSTTPASLTGIYSTLSEVGISIKADGSMSADSTKLQSAIDNHFSDLQSTLGAYGDSVGDMITAMTNSDGTVTARVSSLNNSSHSIDDQKLRLEMRLTTLEANYRRQYSALDAMLGSMSVTSNYLTQQLARL
jgi:flagellar hook-associated protein 2